MQTRNHIRIITVSLCVSLLTFKGCSSDDAPQPVDCAVSTLAVSGTGSGPTSCGATDGSITATATGGDEPYQFAIDAQPFSGSPAFTGLAAGTYQLKVRDKNNCERSKSVTISPFGSTLAATVEITKSGCKTSDGVITINASGGTAPYAYQIDGGAASATSVYDNLAAGNYSVEVTDNTGCSVTQNVEVLNGTSYSTEVQSIITANCAVAGCHVSGGAAPVSFTTFANVQSRAADIKSKTQSGEMPKDAAKLSQDKLDLIACWVEDGALNN